MGRTLQLQQPTQEQCEVIGWRDGPRNSARAVRGAAVLAPFLERCYLQTGSWGLSARCPLGATSSCGVLTARAAWPVCACACAGVRVCGLCACCVCN